MLTAGYSLKAYGFKHFLKKRISNVNVFWFLFLVFFFNQCFCKNW